MGKKSKRGAGKKSRGKGKSKKGKKGKGKKAKKSEVTQVIPEPPDPDVFFFVRRKNTSLLIETTEDLTVTELKLMIATIYGYFPEDIAVFHNEEEMIEKKDLKKKEDDKKKDAGKRGSKGGRGGSKDKKGGKKDKRRKSKDGDKEKKEETVQIFTVGNYGYNARTASIFSPGTVGLVVRDTDGNFEPLEITPWTKPIEIPPTIKQYLRNYNLMSPEVEEAPPEPDNTSVKSKKKS